MAILASQKGHVMCLIEVIKWKIQICWKVACLYQKLGGVIGEWMNHLQHSTELCVSWALMAFPQWLPPWNHIPRDTRGLIYWGFNSGSSLVRSLPLEPCFQSFFFFLLLFIFQIGSHTLYPGIALGCDPPASVFHEVGITDVEQHTQSVFFR
jgi:hypothetical protein